MKYDSPTGKFILKDSEGNVIHRCVFLPGVHEIADDFTPEEVEDPESFALFEAPLTHEQMNERLVWEAQALLQSTDWMVVRSVDTGAPIPDDVKLARANARATISALRGS